MQNTATIKELMPNSTDREQSYVLHSITCKSNAEAARKAGVPETYARQEANKMNNKPEVQQAIATIKEAVGDTDDIDIEDFVTTGLINEAINATASRDKQSAYIALGKTKAMFTDVVESKDVTDDDKLLDKIEQEFGPEARQKAEEGMGLEDATSEG